MAIGPGYPLIPETPMHRVPDQWDHVVCTCAEDQGTKHSLDEHSYMVCRKCSKLKRFYTSYCHDCKQFYLMVFDHPSWNPRVNLCWECIQGVERDPNYPPEYYTYSVTNPPLDKFLRPRRLKTKEEIAAELDELFTFDLII